MIIFDKQVEKFLSEYVILHEKDSPLYNEHVYHIAGIITAFNVFNSIKDAGLHEQLKFKLRDRSQGYLVYGIEIKRTAQAYDIYRAKRAQCEPAIAKVFEKAKESYDEAVCALWAMHNKAFFVETLKYFEKRNPLTPPLIEQLEREIIASGSGPVNSTNSKPSTPRGFAWSSLAASCMARLLSLMV